MKRIKKLGNISILTLTWLLLSPASAAQQTLPQVSLDLHSLPMYLKIGFNKTDLNQSPKPENITKIVTAGTQTRSLWYQIDAGTEGKRLAQIFSFHLPGLPKKKIIQWHRNQAMDFHFNLAFELKNIEKIKEQLAFLIAGIGENWAFYLNGSLLRNEIHPLKNGEIQLFRHNRNAEIDVPYGILKNGTNIIDIHLVGDPTSLQTGFFYSEPFVLKTLTQVREDKSETLTLIFIFMYFMVGLYHLLLFARRPIEKYNLFFGIFAVLIFFYNLGRTNVIGEYIQDTDFIASIELLSFYLLPVFLLLFIDNILQKKFTLFTKILSGIYLAMASTIFVGSVNLKWELIRPWQMILPLTVIYFFYVLVKDFIAEIKKRKNTQGQKKSMMQSVGFVLFNSFSGNLFINLIIFTTTVIHDNIANLTGSSFTLMRFGFFAFIMGIAVTLANKFLNLHREVEELNEYLEQRVEQRTNELQIALSDVNHLKSQQDGDYFLTTLLIKPLSSHYILTENITVDFYTLQRKQFQFKKWQSEIGGDMNIAETILLRERQFSVILNADAMGKSIQGGGGALVLGSVFKSIIERTHNSTSVKKLYPERWLKTTMMELQNVFLSFQGSMYLSLIIALIDNQNGMMYFINAEHPWAVLYRRHRAEFISEKGELRKLGVPQTEDVIYINTCKLVEGDIVYFGSDGRDDILIDENARIYNEDETLFLRKIEESKGNLAEVVNLIQKNGKITDDLSLIKVEIKKLERVQQNEEDEKIAEEVIKAIESAVENDLQNIAIDEAEKLANVKIIRPDLALRTMTALNKIGQHSLAIQIGEYALNANPEHEELIFLIAKTWQLAKNYEAAIDVAERLFLRNPDHTKNSVNLANYYNTIKKYERSKMILTKVLQIDPANKSAIKLLEHIEAKI